MKNLIILSLAAILMTGCNGKIQKDNEPDEVPVTDVSIATVNYGHVDQELELTAVTAFLRKSIVTAPNASYVTACYVEQGSVVHRGQIIYRLESKEREALGGDVMGKNMGIVYLRAGASGVVTEVLQQSGGYVTEGSPLCYIANTSSLVFDVEVPAEDMRYARPGTECRITMPDGRMFPAKLSTPLATMDVNAQVQQIPAHAKVSFLPEGLRVKAILKTSRGGHLNQVLPKAAIQSDDNMTSFWIMKVSDSGCAEKVKVSIGNSNNMETEILYPHFSTTDKIITTGSYQLQEGDKVRIIR